MTESGLGPGLCPRSVLPPLYYISFTLSNLGERISRKDDEKWFFTTFSSKEAWKMGFISLKGLCYPEIYINIYLDTISGPCSW